MFDDLFEDTSAEEDTVVNQVLDEIGIQINSQVIFLSYISNSNLKLVLYEYTVLCSGVYTTKKLMAQHMLAFNLPS